MGLSQAALSTDPAWLQLDRWHGLPGSRAIQEALLRGAGPTIPTHHLCSAVDMLMSSLVTKTTKLTVGTAEALTSRVATFLKLIRVHTHRVAPPGLTDTDAEHEQLSLAQGTGAYISVGCAMHEVLLQSDQLVLAQPDQRARARLFTALHQLSAALAVALVRLSNWRLRIGGSGASAKGCPPWIDELSEKHAHMGALARQLTLPFFSQPGQKGSERAFDKLESRAWEEYAVKHFDGRLLPGCANLGCTSLAGVSEAAMPTLLCSGCRRVRYCCSECQRVGWVAGGHGKICAGRGSGGK